MTNQDPHQTPQQQWQQWQAPPRPGPFAAKPEKKSNTAMWVMLGIVAVVFIVCAGCLGMGAIGSTIEDPSSPTETAAAAEPEKAKTWKTVTTLKGEDRKQGTPFNLTGGRVRMTYTVKDTSNIGASLVGIYVLPEGHNFDTDGGLTEVTTDVGWTGEDSTELTRDTGSYYIKVIAANANWTVTIQELR